MPYPRFPRSFLSCSFDAQDQEVFEWFRKMMDALEFDVLSGEEPTIRSLPEMVRERIRSSQAFVGVLTRRDKIEGSDEWFPPTWVRDEVAMAYSLGKPVAIFAEEGVRVDGIVPQLTKYEIWRRADLGRAAPTVVRYLLVLRNGISPPEDLSGDLATIRALGEDLHSLSTQLESIETTLELNTFSLVFVTAHTTGRLYTIPDELREKVVAAYRSVDPVEAVLKEIEEARRTLKSAVSKALWYDPSPGPPLPPESPLWTKLRVAVEKADEAINAASLALLRAGYPETWEKIRRYFIEAPEGPQKEQARTDLRDAFGFGEDDLRPAPPV